MPGGSPKNEETGTETLIRYVFAAIEEREVLLREEDEEPRDGQAQPLLRWEYTTRLFFF